VSWSRRLDTVRRDTEADGAGAASWVREPERGDDDTTPGWSEVAPRDDTVRVSLAVTGLAADGFRLSVGPGRCLLGSEVDCDLEVGGVRLSGVRERCSDVEDIAESTDLRGGDVGSSGETGERDPDPPPLERTPFWLCRRLSIHPTSLGVGGIVPFSEAGAGVPASLASFNMLACCMSSVISGATWAHSQMKPYRSVNGGSLLLNLVAVRRVGTALLDWKKEPRFRRERRTVGGRASSGTIDDSSTDGGGDSSAGD
jgi:hypothetical protein